eukprot:5925626-Pyramimonas_sp.AAC.1
MQFKPADVFYSVGEGALTKDRAKAVLKAKGAELRTRARGQRATTIKARSGVLRHALHVVEGELNRLDIPFMFTRVSPCNALFGRQPAMLPDLPLLDHELQTETSDHFGELIICRVSIEAITQAAAIAKTNRALRTKTTMTGQHYYDGDL